MDTTILVATASQGVIRSADAGRSWHRIGLGQPIEFDGVVRSLDLDPVDPRVVFAGADVGLCRSEDVGANWTLLDSPFVGETVWKVAVDPTDRRRIFVGTGAPSRAVLWRTLDGGASWLRCGVEFPEFCAGVNRPRLLAFSYNPQDRRKLWFGVEAGGLFRSSDGGDNWEQVDQRLQWDYHADVHAIHVLPDPDQTVVVVCVNAVYTSRDGGETWDGMLPKTQFGLYYARALTALPHSADTVYVSISDGTPGATSKILVSRDGARSWQPARVDQAPGSCFWAIHANPRNPVQMVAGTKYGELYISHDAGRNWKKEWRTFPEISDVRWVPARTVIMPAHRSDVA